LDFIREDHYLVKILTLRMVFALLEKLKERYLTQHNIKDYIAECLEDTNEKVNSEAFKVIKFIEKQTGEDFKNYVES
jgi:hypothetical protein